MDNLGGRLLTAIGPAHSTPIQRESGVPRTCRISPHASDTRVILGRPNWAPRKRDSRMGETMFACVPMCSARWASSVADNRNAGSHAASTSA
jgi:hypothetical protein